MKRSSAVDPAVVSSWVPKTELGREVKGKKITTFDEIVAKGRPILESEIIDALMPNLKQELIELSSTQRMTDSGRKSKYRAVVIVGDEERYLGVGHAKADEVRPSVETALKEAKYAVIPVVLGCGSWECGCGLPHSTPIKVTGQHGGVKVTLKPAPRGTGIVANPIIRMTLQLAGMKDVWTKAEGRTRNRLNTVMAVHDALNQLNKMRIKQDWSTTATGAVVKAEAAKAEKMEAAGSS